MLPLHQLLAFTELAKCGSFTVAARQLGVSTASVSRAVSSLEDELGVRLFNRTTRHLNLTDEGRVFYESVRSGLDRLDEAAARLTEYRTEAIGTIHVCMPESFCKSYIIARLPDFLAQNPRLRVDIALHDYPMDLLTGGFELAVQFGRPADSSYVARRLGKTRVVLVASPQYLAARGVPQTPADLSAHDCITVRLASNKTPLWRFQNGPAPTDELVPELSPTRLVLSHQLDVVVDAALAGIGITACAAPVVMKHLKAGTLRIVLPEFPLSFGSDESDLFVLYPHREYVPPRVRLFVDFLFGSVREATPPFDPREFAA